LNNNCNYESGTSLLEVMAVVLIIAIIASITMPLLQQQIAYRELESVARRFIAHAYFARQQALHLGEPVKLAPKLEGAWSSGWTVGGECKSKSAHADCGPRVWLSHPKTAPIFFKGGEKRFVDPHTGKAGILFNAAGAAKTAHGGFVANRLILGHQRLPNSEMHLILGSGGRWRICDPARDAKRCH
jgi:type IV fimbrial biogenesis protein FimT